MQKARLEEALHAVPDFPHPDPGREQYRTPATVAAHLLWQAHQDGAIAARDVLDLGCGTGIFSLGAHLLGAAHVTGVDSDAEAVAVARTIVQGTFVVSDVEDWQPARRFDTVVMNPPFGAQRRGADRPFYEAAARAVGPGGTCWFLAQPRTEGFLVRTAAKLGARLERIASWTYPIEARFAFHASQVRSFDVAGYCMAW